MSWSYLSPVGIGVFTAALIFLGAAFYGTLLAYECWRCYRQYHDNLASQPPLPSPLNEMAITITPPPAAKLYGPGVNV